MLFFEWNCGAVSTEEVKRYTVVVSSGDDEVNWNYLVFSKEVACCIELCCAA